MTTKRTSTLLATDDPAPAPNDEGANGDAKISRYLQYLPAIFHRAQDKTQPAEIWVNKFLLAFEQEYARIDDLLAVIDERFSPTLLNTEEAADFLPWLATWVALALDEAWDEEKRRRLISEAVQLYRWRGTAYGLKRYLEIYTELEQQAITIVDGQRPSGMQIGVASRIGKEVIVGPAANPEGDGRLVTPGKMQESATANGGVSPRWTQGSYYIVETVTPTAVLPDLQLPELPAGSPLQLYYAADVTDAKHHVARVQLEENGVRLWVHQRRVTAGKPDNTGDPAQTATTSVELFHPRPPTMTTPNIRRVHTTDYTYVWQRPQQSDQIATSNYQGGSFLVDQMEAPYHFIVDLRAAPVEGETEIDNLWQRLGKVQAILDRERPAHTIYHLTITPTAEVTTHQWMQIEVRSTIGIDSTIG